MAHIVEGRTPGVPHHARQDDSGDLMERRRAHVPKLALTCLPARARIRSAVLLDVSGQNLLYPTHLPTGKRSRVPGGSEQEIAKLGEVPFATVRLAAEFVDLS